MEIEKEIKEIINSLGVNYYDSEVVNENNNKIFRIYITSKEGITLDKCAEVSEVISPLLDLNPPIKDKYFLEVSSPGIERKLKTLNHFNSSIGELVKITLYSTEKIEGKILEVKENIIKIREEDGEIVEINFDDISKAKTYFVW